MITLINEEKMTLKNYDNFMQINGDDLACYIVDWNKSLDGKPIIDFYTMEQSIAYASDVI